jgi:hypothetical protein
MGEYLVWTIMIVMSIAGARKICWIFFAMFVWDLLSRKLPEKKSLRVIDMKIYLDDVRPIPDGWVGVRTYDEAVAVIKTGKVKEISLDHDLGPGKTGYDLVCLIEKMVVEERFIPPVMRIHSANPVGRSNMERAIQSIERLFGAMFILDKARVS